MIRRFLTESRNRKTRRRHQKNAKPKSKGLNQFELLEDRRMLAFGFVFDGTTLTLTQTVDDGAIVIDNNGGGDAFQATDGAGLVTYVAATNLTVDLLDNTGNTLDLDLDNAHAGNVTLNLGDGARAVNFIGTGNATGGDLTVTGGADAQTVEIAVNAGLSVTGSASFDLGSGLDTVDEDNNDISIGVDFILIGVNGFENGGTMTVGGNMSADASAETIAADIDNDNSLTINGDFTFLGGSGEDFVQLNATTNVLGNVNVSLGDSSGGGGAGQTFRMNDPGNSVGGTITVTAGDNLDGFSDDFLLSSTGTFGGDITVTYGAGPNTIQIIGVFGGSNVSYTGGSGVDSVLYDLSGSLADVTIDLGAGNDTFTLGPNVSIAPSTLSVDFGDNADTFTNNFGNFTFNTTLLGLSGFDYAYDHGSSTLTASEVSGVGPFEFDTNGVGGAFRFNNALSITAADNFTVNMLNGSGNQLDMDLDTALAGDLVVNLGDGTRALNFVSGIGNTIDGNLTVTGGADAQTVEVAVNFGLTVGGSATFDLGQGDDTVDEDNNNISIGSDFVLIGVNGFENGGTMTVGGNMSVDVSAETIAADIDNDNSLTINGDFTFLGGSGEDFVQLNSTSNILGNVLVSLGDSSGGGGAGQTFRMNDPGNSVGGTITVTAGDNLDGFSDDFLLNSTGTFGGDITVAYGAGPNTIQFLGVFGGSKVRYTGGSGADSVTYGMTGAPAFVNAKLGAGDDSFTLNAGASISPTTLRVDFGGGNDTFTNNFGAFTFNAALLNWHGYNRYYTFADDLWNMHQVIDTGNVTIDNNGAGGAIRLISSGVSEMTASANVRLNLLDNTTSNVTVDLDSALAGNLLLQLRHGARNVMFTGTSNNIGGYLIMLGGDGINTFDLAVNADLVVGTDVIINGRDGSDTVDDGVNNITAGGNFILRGINKFENTNTLTVGGNFNMVTSLETEDSILDNDGIMNVSGGLNYLGGDGVDDVLLNTGGVNVGQVLYVNLGDSTSLGLAQHVSLTGGVFASYVSVKGGASFVGNEFLTDATTNVTGNVIVDFSGNAVGNKAFFFGTYGGVYGTYRGGSAGDTVRFGANAIDMAFVSLMNDGNDIFTLEATTSLLSLVIDFGNHTDTFIDNLGAPYAFPATILNLP